MIKYLSLFSGIGAFEVALDNQNIDFELVGYCEIDRYASESYAAIHGVDESWNLGDITKQKEWDLPNDIDLITYGFPCQDISLAGKQKGLFNDDGTQTRSGLFFEALDIIETYKPKIAIAENVKNLTSKKFKEQFQIVLNSLEEAGYNNYWKVLNAKDYGIPQNRERVFIVSIRKDIDHGLFQFPEPYPLDKRLKDMLEDEVDEKFYLSNKMTEYLTSTKFHQDSDTVQTGDVCKCLRVGGTTPCVESISKPPTLRIRKLTPKECFRLMGFDDADHDACVAAGISNTQLYKQAGNSIVVDVLEELFCMMFDEDGNLYV